MIKRIILSIALLCFAQTYLQAKSGKSFQQVTHMVEYISHHYSGFLTICKKESVKNRLSQWDILPAQEQDALFQEIYTHMSKQDLRGIGQDIKKIRRSMYQAQHVQSMAQHKYLHMVLDNLQTFYSLAKKHRGTYHAMHRSALHKNIDSSSRIHITKEGKVKRVKSDRAKRAVLATIAGLGIGAMLVAGVVYTAVFAQS